MLLRHHFGGFLDQVPLHSGVKAEASLDAVAPMYKRVMHSINKEDVKETFKQQSTADSRAGPEVRRVKLPQREARIIHAHTKKTETKTREAKKVVEPHKPYAQCPKLFQLRKKQRLTSNGRSTRSVHALCSRQSCDEFMHLRNGSAAGQG